MDRALQGRSRARLLGHAVGLLSYEIPALAGAAGGLAWFLGLQLLPVLVAMELLIGALNAPGRRLKRLSVEVYGTDVQARQAQALASLCGHLPWRAALRSVAVWLAAGSALFAFFGATRQGLLLLMAFGAIQAASAQAGFCGALVQAAAEEGALEAPGLAPSASGVPSGFSSRTRFWMALGAPLAAVLLPLAALRFSGIALSGPVLAALSGLGLVTALAWTEALVRPETRALRALAQALQRLAGGNFDLEPLASGPDAWGEAARALNFAAPALETRERAWRVFGSDVDPQQSHQSLESSGSPAALRGVAVLSAAWLEADAALSALDPVARLSALGRFYESVQEAVRRGGGTVVELGGGQVLAAWGALGPESGSDQASGRLGALKAAWHLRSSLAVAASQHRLRHATPMTWAVGLAWGEVASGFWGPKKDRRWALAGGPLVEARRLGQKPGGPWVSEKNGAELPASYGVQGGLEGYELHVGPE